MNIARNSIRKNYYLIPKSFVKCLTIASSGAVFYHIGKKWNFFEKFYIKVEEVEKKINCEEMKNSCLNFVGEMLYDNLAKIDVTNYFNEVLNNSENSLIRDKENDKKTALVQDLLKRVLNDKTHMDKISTKFMHYISESEMKDIFNIVSNREDLKQEITDYLKELFTSDEVAVKFRELLETNSKNYIDSKDIKKNITSFTEVILQDDDLKPKMHLKLQQIISSLKSDKDEEMKKVNKELIELINKL